MLYRSAVIFGACSMVDDPAEKRAALDLLTDSFLPGRVGRGPRADDEGARRDSGAAAAARRVVVEGVDRLGRGSARRRRRSCVVGHRAASRVVRSASPGAGLEGGHRRADIGPVARRRLNPPNDVRSNVESPPECRMPAIASTPSTTRGPGRTTNASASIAQTSARGKCSAAVVACCAAPARPNPHGATITTSGRSPAIAPQDVGADRSCGWHATGVPPAATTMSGIQCPAPNTGSIHSITATRGRGRSRTRSSIAARRRRSRSTRRLAAVSAPACSPTATIDSRIASRVWGSSVTTSAVQPRCRSASSTRPWSIAQTRQRS